MVFGIARSRDGCIASESHRLLLSVHVMEKFIH